MKNRFVILSFLALLVIGLAACGESSNTEQIAVGNIAPDFTLANSEGVQVSLSDYAGQPVLLFFHMAGG